MVPLRRQISCTPRSDGRPAFTSSHRARVLDVVDDCYREMKRLKNLTAYFTNKNISVSYLRAKKKADTQRVVSLYGDGSEKYW